MATATEESTALKVVVDCGAFKEALAVLDKVAMAKAPKPVLTGVLLTGRDGKLEMTATDLEARLTMSLERVEVQTPGQVLVPAALLRQAVGRVLDPAATLTVEGGKLCLTGSRERICFYGLPVEEFPHDPALSDVKTCDIEAKTLAGLLRSVVFAVASENSRYAINGVLIESTGTRLQVVATDGHRLAMNGVAAKGDKFSAIVPAKAVKLAIALFAGDEGTVGLATDGQRILFGGVAVSLASQLVEGDFPPYKDVIPKDPKCRAVLSTDDLLAATEEAAVMTGPDSKGVAFAFGKDGLHLSSRAADVGEAEVTIELDESDARLAIGFNPGYLTDALRAVDENRVTLRMSEPNKPLLMEAGSFRYVLMPVNLQ